MMLRRSKPFMFDGSAASGYMLRVASVPAASPREALRYPSIRNFPGEAA